MTGSMSSRRGFRSRPDLLRYIITTAEQFGLDARRGNAVFVPHHGDTMAFVDHGVNVEPHRHGPGWLVRYFRAYGDDQSAILAIATVAAHDHLLGICRGRYRRYS